MTMLNNYDSATFEYLNTTQAQRDPLKENGFFTNRPFSTLKDVPVTGINEKAVFNVGLDDWEVKPDYRGKEYFKKLTGESVFFELGETPDDTVQDTLPISIQAEREAAALLNTKKAARDEALSNLTHNFLDGRVMQVRPKDESNIRNAIEVMTANSMTSINWVMLDDKKYPVTVVELKAALASGQAQALTIWGNFNP